MPSSSRSLVAAGLALALLNGCSNVQPTIAESSPALPVVTRAEFNNRAAERFLPLLWREDDNGDGAIQPTELAVLWGYPDDDAALWIDAQGGFTPKFIDALALLQEPTPQPASRRRQLVLDELAQSVPTLVHTDMSSDSDAERAMVRHVMRAGTLIERLYARQRGVLGLDQQIAPDDRASRALFHRNQSPFCEAPATEQDPLCGALESMPRRRSGLYPPEIQDAPDFCQRLEQLPNAAVLSDPFTVVVASAATGALEAVPFAEAWREDMVAVASELEAAADALGAAEPALAAYLRAAAGSFRSNDQEPANRAWKAMNARNSRWYLRVAGDEVGQEPCAWKAGFALQFARINPDSLTWQERLEPLKGAMEAHIASMAGAPYVAHDVQFALPDFVDVVLNAGDQRHAVGATVGQSLPNWGPVAEAGGRTIAMTNLYTDADSRARRAAQESALLCGATASSYAPTGSEGVIDSLLHEAAHNLGPSADYAVDGRSASVAFGGPLASTIEELKAQNSALWLADFLREQGVLGSDEYRRILRDGVTWAFDQASRGMYYADGSPRTYGQISAIQIGSFLDAGALSWREGETAANGQDLGCFGIDYARLPAAVEALERQALAIKARADRDEAETLKARYVDANGRFAEIKRAVSQRYLRTPKASFVYSVGFPR